jgi:hypothetical protein
MKGHGGIDLHSNNGGLALLDEQVWVVDRKRLPNDAAGVLQARRGDGFKAQVMTLSRLSSDCGFRG